MRDLLGRTIGLLIPVVLLGLAIVWLVDSEHRVDDGEAARRTATEELAIRQGVVDDARARRRAANQSNRELLRAAAGLQQQAARLVDLQRRAADIAARQRDALLADDAGGYNSLVDQQRALADESGQLVDALSDALRTYGAAIAELPPASCPAEPSPTLEWVDYGGGTKCARLEVPLDHADPDGPTIAITVARHAAEGPGRSLGALLLNPGGPGGSGLDMLRGADNQLPAQLRQRFDLIGFDPRGVGESTPVDCTDDLDAFFAVDHSPDDDAEWTALEEAVTTFTDGCVQRSGDLLAHIGTEDVARDMEQIRVALGAPKISYLGYSYGSLLGATYADLFPGRVRAFVLDGAVLPPRPTDEEVDVDRPIGLDVALERVLDGCSDDPDCAFGGTSDAGIAYDRLLDDLAEDPLEVDGLLVNDTVAQIASGAALYGGTSSERRLLTALAAAEDGRGRPLAELFSDYDGRYPGGSYDNSFEALVAVNCLAEPDRPTAAELEEANDERSSAAPPLASTMATALACAQWPVEPVTVDQPHAEGSKPILVVGTTDDPVTSYATAVRMARQLDRGILLTYRGGGHTAFGGRNGCVDLRVTAYLIDLTVPEEGTTCR